MSTFYKEKINDPRLKPGLVRTRSGREQVFYGRDGSFDNPDLVLTHEKPEMYAELIDGEWHWVNGCAYCDDAHPSEKGSPFSYSLCDKHNVCGVCGQHRSVFKEPVWGRSDMAFCCQSCQEQQNQEEKQESLQAAFEKHGVDDDWHHENEEEIICPYCNTVYQDEEYGYSDPCKSHEHECHTCGETFMIEAEISINYTTTAKRPKEDVYREAGLLDAESDGEDEDDSLQQEDTPKSENASESATDYVPKRDEMSDVLNEVIKGK